MNRRKVMSMLPLPFLLPKGSFAMSCFAMTPDWAFVADTVMGGVSQGQIGPDEGTEHAGMRLTGRVSLDNNGGFIQMASNMGVDGGDFDASAYRGVAFFARGNGETYAAGLRTSELSRPWQSYRAEFVTTPDWQWVEIPFSDFKTVNTERAFNAARLRRIGILGIGRAFDVDVSVANLCLTA